MQNDSLSDVLTRLRNGTKKNQVLIPLTRFNLSFCKILKEQGFIKQFRLVTESRFFIKVELGNITNLKRLSKPGARLYTKNKQMSKMFNGIGILIVSTSQGIMTDREARFRSLGGELLCSIW